MAFPVSLSSVHPAHGEVEIRDPIAIGMHHREGQVELERHGAEHREVDLVAVHSGVECGCTTTSARTNTFTEGFALAFATAFSSRPSFRRGDSPGVRIGGSRRLFDTWTSRPSRALHPSVRPADSLVRLRPRPPATTAPRPHGTTPSPPPPDTRTPIVLVDGTSRSPSRSARTTGCRGRSSSPA